MDHLKHIVDYVTGAITMANFFSLVTMGVTALPMALTIISTSLAIVWYVIRIRHYLKKGKLDES